MTRVCAGILILAGLCGAVDKDMQRAIAWERHKEAAARRQARIEARHPSVPDVNSANRSAEDEPAGRKVMDPGPGKAKK